MKEELIALEQRTEALQRAVKAAPAPARLLHSNLADVYRQKVAELKEELNRLEVRAEAAATSPRSWRSPRPAESRLRVLV